MKKGMTPVKDASEVATKRRAATEYSLRQKLYQGAVAPVVPKTQALAPMRMPYQRPTYDAPGCVIWSPLDGERLN